MPTVLFSGAFWIGELSQKLKTSLHFWKVLRLQTFGYGGGSLKKIILSSILCCEKFQLFFM